MNERMNEPMNLPPLRDASVVVAVPDATRPVAWDRTLVPLLKQLDRDRADVRIEVALGLHRKMNAAELEPIATAARPFGVPVTQHDPERDDFAPHLLRADALVCVGVVEPHQYAGYSGGIKTVAIGCAPRKMIAHSHRIELLRDPRVALGRYYDNPFQDELWERAKRLPATYGVYLVPDHTTEPHPESKVLSGPVRPTMEAAVATARELHFEPYPAAMSWLALDVPSAKAANFYQASRAATYAGLVDSPAVKPGGLLVLRAAIPEGIGTGSGERACAEQMLRGRRALLDDLKGTDPVDAPGGAQRAYVIARTLERFRIALVGSTCGPLGSLSAMGIEQFPTLEDALEHHGVTGDGAIVDNPFHRVPTGPPAPNDPPA